MAGVVTDGLRNPVRVDFVLVPAVGSVWGVAIFLVVLRVVVVVAPVVGFELDRERASSTSTGVDAPALFEPDAYHA